MRNIILPLIAMAALLSSCAGLTLVTVPESNINYNNTDIETERKVQYTLTKTYVFGIGGMSEAARNTDIIEELMKKANLQTNETLAYISVSRNVNVYAGVVSIVKSTATGYVVRPKDNNKEVEVEKGEETTASKSSSAAEMMHELSKINTPKGTSTLTKEVIYLSEKIEEINTIAGFSEIEKVIKLKSIEGAISKDEKKFLLDKIRKDNLYNRMLKILANTTDKQALMESKAHILANNNISVEQMNSLIATADKLIKNL